MRRALGLAAVAALGVGAAGCGGASGSTGPTAAGAASPAASRCSAQGVPALPAKDGLPAPVAATEQAIDDAATTCDLTALARLAVTGGSFEYGGTRYTDAARLAAHWRDLESRGTKVTATVVELLTVPAAPAATSEGRVFVAPAFATAPTADNRTALTAAIGADALRRDTAGGRYTGWAVRIGPDGTWRGFTTG